MSNANYDFTFLPEMQYFCLKNCVYQMLSLMEYKYPLLHIKTGFELKVLFQDKEGLSVFKHHSLMPLFNMNYLECGSGDDFEEIFADNCKALTIVLADVFYLPYRQEYKKYHASHSIFLAGYDKKNSEVEIIDWYHPYYFKGFIAYSDFKDARCSTNPKDMNPFSGFEIKNYWYSIDKKRFKNSIEDTIVNNISRMDKTLKNEEKHIYSGKYAIAKVIEYLKSAENMEEIFQKKLCLKLHDEFYVYYRAAMLSKIYFQEASQYKGINIFKGLLGYIDETIEQLSIINFCFMKGGVSNPSGNWKRALNCFEKLELIQY